MTSIPCASAIDRCLGSKRSVSTVSVVQQDRSVPCLVEAKQLALPCLAIGRSTGQVPIEMPLAMWRVYCAINGKRNAQIGSGSMIFMSNRLSFHIEPLSLRPAHGSVILQRFPQEMVRWGELARSAFGRPQRCTAGQQVAWVAYAVGSVG